MTFLCLAQELPSVTADFAGYWGDGDLRSQLSKIVMIGLSVVTVCCVADSNDIASQGFIVVVPPKASFSEQQSGAVRQVTISATVDMWVQCDTVAKTTSSRHESAGWGQKILCQQPTTVKFANPTSNNITVITFAAF